MNLQFTIFNNKRQILVLVLGLVALVGSVAVLGLTVMRARNLAQPTVSLPKAAESFCSPDAQPPCCNQIAAGKGFDQCTWSDRGKCTPTQCAASNNAPTPNCAHLGGDPTRPTAGPANCNCGLLYNTYCTTSCSLGGNVNSNSQYPMVSQTGMELTPTFTWAYNQAISGGPPYANVRIWSCAQTTDDCMVFAGTTEPWTSVPITSFYKEGAKGANFAADWATDGYHVKNLKPNKQYWWQLTWGVQNCGVKCTGGIPGDANYPCTNWAFMTGAGAPAGGSIQGYKRVGADNNNPAVKDLAVTLDGGSPVTTNPYFHKNVPAGKHTVAVTPPAGYSAGYTLCYNRTDCHTQTPTPGNSVAVDISPDGYADLWWHFTQSATCPTGQTMCGTTCTDIKTDANNCNACGAKCSSGQTCSNGVCTTANTCPTGKSLCGSSCVDITTDTNNCGACGKVCASGESCVNSTCTGGSGEADTCWGNEGTSGKCYDCDGNGVINVLDFSCFRIRYGSVVTP